MNIEANTKTTTKYLVYWDGEDGEIIAYTYTDLAVARSAATANAKDRPGREFYIAALMTTFRAEIEVKEV